MAERRWSFREIAWDLGAGTFDGVPGGERQRGGAGAIEPSRLSGRPAAVADAVASTH
jgi:hypothetical protein